jgi:ABC-2 type transport system ATP-binding protein
MIRLNQVEKYYDRKLILQIQALELENGIYWINGVNGSGKTTFLKMLSGIIPFKGDAFLNGTSLKKKPVEYRRLVSYAEAEPLYPSFMTGSDLVSFYADVRKATGKETDQLIAFSGLHEHLAQPIGTYSSGMVKRLSLLLAFIGHPPLIFLDEPLATLDAAAASALPDLINKYRLEYGTSFIFSSHQPIASETSLIARKLSITNQTIHPGL